MESNSSNDEWEPKDNSTVEPENLTIPRPKEMSKPKREKKAESQPHPWEGRVLHGSDIHFYKIEGGKKRHIVSIEALYASGCFPLILQGPERRNLGMTEADVDEILAKTPKGEPITLVPMP